MAGWRGRLGGRGSGATGQSPQAAPPRLPPPAHPLTAPRGRPLHGLSREGRRGRSHVRVEAAPHAQLPTAARAAAQLSPPIAWHASITRGSRPPPPPPPPASGAPVMATSSSIRTPMPAKWPQAASSGMYSPGSIVSTTPAAGGCAAGVCWGRSSRERGSRGARAAAPCRQGMLAPAAPQLWRRLPGSSGRSWLMLLLSCVSRPSQCPTAQGRRAQAERFVMVRFFTEAAPGRTGGARSRGRCDARPHPQQPAGRQAGKASPECG